MMIDTVRGLRDLFGAMAQTAAARSAKAEGENASSLWGAWNAYSDCAEYLSLALEGTQPKTLKRFRSKGTVPYIVTPEDANRLTVEC
jgi:hypothetical protein